MEHLRPHRGHRRRLRGQARRNGAGQHRAAATGLGPGGGRQGRCAGPHRRGRRTGDRRGGAGPLPGSAERRREVRADADAGVEPRLPQRRPGATGTRRPLLPGPRRRPGQGRRAAHRARRVGRRADASARRQRRRGRGATNRQRHAGAGGLYRQRRPVVRPGEGPRRPGRDAARRAGAPAGPGRRTAHPHLRQGGPRRAAVAAARRKRRGSARPGRRHDGLAGRAMARRARRADRGSRGRLPRPRRRLAVGGATGGRAAAALPAGDGRRPV